MMVKVAVTDEWWCCWH